MKRWKKIIIATVVIVISAVAYALWCRHYYDTTINVPLKLIASITMKEDVVRMYWIGREKKYNEYWKVIKSQEEEQSFNDYYHLKLPRNDYKANYLLVSFARPIIHLSYYRRDNFTDDHHRVGYVGDEVYGDQFSLHTYYIYQMKPIFLSHVSELEQYNYD